MAKIKERGKTGAAKNYITRNQALKKCVSRASGRGAGARFTHRSEVANGLCSLIRGLALL